MVKRIKPAKIISKLSKEFTANLSKAASVWIFVARPSHNLSIACFPLFLKSHKRQDEL